jgi:predicted DNA-binding transcriptional regulator YafY
MLDLKSKLKRQIEILGIILSQNYGMPLKTFDLADMFRVEELTIKRDLQDLRASGIKIHSEKKRGVNIYGILDEKKLRELIHQYSALTSAESGVEKSTSLLVKRLGEKALANIITLQMCIEKNSIAAIDYEKESDELEFGRKICPVLIFERDNYWRVLAVNNDRLKQFHLNKIIEVRETKKSFKPVSSEKIEDVFKHSWRSWIGDKTFNVKLRFSANWSERIKPKQLMDNESFKQNADGSVSYETTVNSLEEIAGWIASRGEGITVLEPDELKAKVIELAKGVLKNYE